ncbi:MAG: hypothetical protein ACREA0_09540 [bacterium]
MTTVFIGGSRVLSRLNRAVRDKLDDLIDRGCTILIGDANGADKAVQSYLAHRGYPKVVVFCMNSCRNNVGQWQSRPITSPTGKRDFAYYATKDRVMVREARCGIMFWDGKSKGTLNNILSLLNEQKKVLVYFAPTKAFQKLSNEDDLRALLELCDSRHVERITRELGHSDLVGTQMRFHDEAPPR